MAAQQVDLQCVEGLARHLHLGEGPEARVDAVHRRVAGRLFVDDRPCRIDARPRRRREARVVGTAGEGGELVEGERLAIEENHGRAPRGAHEGESV